MLMVLKFGVQAPAFLLEYVACAARSSAIRHETKTMVRFRNLLDSVLNNVAVDGHTTVLTETHRSRNCLIFDKWIPSRFDDVNYIRGRKVDAVGICLLSTTCLYSICEIPTYPTPPVPIVINNAFRSCSLLNI